MIAGQKLGNAPSTYQPNGSQAIQQSDLQSIDNLLFDILHHDEPPVVPPSTFG